MVYLGGLLPRGPRVSTHLASRAEVGELLRQHLPTLELRAGPVIGAGSGSFEMRSSGRRAPKVPAPCSCRLLVQTAGFEPKALAGWLCWWLLYPMHRLIFSSLVRAIAREAQRN